MTEEEIFAKINEIFKDIFDDEDLFITRETTADDIEDWDSLEHINLVVAIEKTFKIKLKMADVVAFKNVGDMASVIERELAK